MMPTHEMSLGIVKKKASSWGAWLLKSECKGLLQHVTSCNLHLNICLWFTVAYKCRYTVSETYIVRPRLSKVSRLLPWVGAFVIAFDAVHASDAWVGWAILLLTSEFVLAAARCNTGHSNESLVLPNVVLLIPMLLDVRQYSGRGFSCRS